MRILRAASSLLLLPGLMLFGSQASAQLGTASTTFEGTVDGSCTITKSNNNTVTLTSDGNGTLTGTSGSIEVAANVAVRLSLSDLVEVAKGGGTPTVSATLDVVDAVGGNGDDMLTATYDGNATKTYSQATALGNATDNTSYTTHLDMTVSDASAPGTYTYTLVLNCLQM